MDIKKKKDKYRNIAELKFEQIASLMSWLFSLSLGFIIYLNVKKIVILPPFLLETVMCTGEIGSMEKRMSYSWHLFPIR